MSGEVSVLSGAPVVDIDPITQQVTVMLGGPAGPSGESGGAHTWWSGSGAPSGADGSVGDFYMDTLNDAYYGPKGGGGWGVAHPLKGANGTIGSNGTNGTDGVDGRTWYSGSGAPGSGVGVNGDFYMDITNSIYYGPKTAGAWPTGKSIIGAPGSNGTNGANGTNGTNGVDGRTWYSGSGVPSNALGANGDFYMDTTNSIWYGPKAGGAWGTGTSLFGKTWRNGTGAPNNSLGGDGDFYLDTAASVYYGPKASGAWPAGVALIGRTWLSGAGAPSSGIGNNGDFYLDVTNKTFYGPKAGGAWPSAVSMIGATGASGNSWLYGSGAPASGLGNNGDFYMDTTAKAFYGPKASGAWPGAVSLIGASGTNGKTWYSGTAAPSNAVGADGDFFMDVTNKMWYGPKASGAWPAGVSMVGATSVSAAYDGRIPADSPHFGVSSEPGIDPDVQWANGTSLQTIVQQLGDAVSVESWIRRLHTNSQQQHGMPAPGPQLVYRDDDGVIPIVQVTTAPASGDVPPAGTIWMWSVGNAIYFRNHAGDQTQLLPGWDTVFLPLASDNPDIISNTTLATILSSPSLAASSEWYVEMVTGHHSDNTGGIKIGFTAPAGAAFDFVQEGLDPADTGGDSVGLMKKFSGNLASTAQGYGGQGSTRRAAVTTKGYLVLDTTAGALSMQCAQNAPSTTALKIRKAITFMRLERVK